MGFESSPYFRPKSDNLKVFFKAICTGMVSLALLPMAGWEKKNSKSSRV